MQAGVNAGDGEACAARAGGRKRRQDENCCEQVEAARHTLRDTLAKRRNAVVTRMQVTMTMSAKCACYAHVVMPMPFVCSRRFAIFACLRLRASQGGVWE